MKSKLLLFANLFALLGLFLCVGAPVAASPIPAPKPAGLKFRALPTPKITFPQLAPVIYGTDDVTPGATSTNTSVALIYTSSNLAVATIVNNNIHIVGAGSTTITAFQPKSATYTAAAPVQQTFTVNQAPLTIEANNASKTYGWAIPAFTASYVGFVKGETSAVLKTQPAFSTTATASSPVGAYPITAQGAVAANYAITYTSGTLTITKAPLSIAVVKPTITYGTAIPVLTASYTGFVNGETFTVLTTLPVLSTAAAASSPVGQYPIKISGAVAANYSIAYVGGNLTISKAPLTIAVVKSTITYGSAIPALTANYSGFVNGESPAVLTALPVLSTTATSLSPPGLYPIKISGAAAANYAIAYTGGNLTIARAPLTIAAINVVKTAGGPNPVFAVTYNGFVNGQTNANLTTQPKITTTATTSSPAGVYPITVSGAVDANYAFIYVQGTLFVNAPSSAPIISYASPQTFVEGTAVSLAPTNTGGAMPAQNQSAVTTFAGSGAKGAQNGTGTAAAFNTSTGGIAVDAFNNAYVADQGNNLIRKISSVGVVSTFAGSGAAGADNNVGVAASFNQPTGIVIDNAGNLYVADAGNNMIRKITPNGTVSTYAGSGLAGATNGVGVAASFNSPQGLAIALSGNLYTLDTKNGAIRKITTAGVVTTIAKDSLLTKATGITIDGVTNTIIVAASDNYIRRVTLTGVITIIAGNGLAGSSNGPAHNASFNNPGGVGIFGDGSILIADAGNNKLRILRTDGTVTDYAGNGISGLVNSDFSTASFKGPVAFGTRNFDTFYINDSGNNVIRRMGRTGFFLSGGLLAGLSFDSVTGIISGTPTAVKGPTPYTITAYNTAGISTTNVTISVTNPNVSPNIYTIAGNGTAGFSGDGGLATAATLDHPYAMALDKTGNMYIASYGDSRVRKIDATTKKITTIAGTGIPGYSGDGGLATSAQLSFGLVGIAVDASGNVYIGDYNNNRVRMINASSHKIATIAGTGFPGNSGDGGLATAAQLNGPGGIAVDANNNIYISDENNATIRKIDALTHKISTVVTGLGFVERMTFDKKGNMYFADEGFYTVSKMDAVTKNVSVIAGTGNPGFSGDGGQAVAAQLLDPIAVAIDSIGNIYISDQPANVIRKIDAATNIISTYAGNAIGGYSGDGASASLAQINFQTDIVFDAAGKLYIVDLSNHAIRRIGGIANPQTITFATIPTQVYGAPLNAQPATASSGLKVSYTSSNPAVAAFLNDTTLNILRAGSTTITASQPGNGNFLPAASVSRVMNVTAAKLTIKADDKTKIAGAANPSLTVTYTGFVNNETAVVLSKLPVLSTTAKDTSHVGSYPITVSGAAAVNYSITYVPGKLTVTAPPAADRFTAKVTNANVQMYQSGAGQVMQPNVRAAISPNGDGVNDVLVIDGISNFPENKLTVVSRSGSKIFEVSGYDNVSKVFSGHSNITGSRQQPGTYFYVLQYTDKGVAKRKTGYFVLKQ